MAFDQNLILCTELSPCSRAAADLVLFTDYLLRGSQVLGEIHVLTHLLFRKLSVKERAQGHTASKWQAVSALDYDHSPFVYIAKIKVVVSCNSNTMISPMNTFSFNF